LQESPGHLETVDPRRAADFDDSLTEEGHERSVPWENPYEAIVGRRHDGVGLPFEHGPLGRDYRDAHQEDAIFFA
jgi:hypothetical protein